MIVLGLDALDLLARACWKSAMPQTEDTMTPVEMAGLLDAAFGNRHTLTFLDMAMTTFRTNGRAMDATAMAVIGCLYAEGEIELLMRLRATWKLGRAKDPQSVIK